MSMGTISQELQQRLDRMKNAKVFPAQKQGSQEQGTAAAAPGPAMAGNRQIAPELQQRLNNMRTANEFPAVTLRTGTAGQALSGARRAGALQAAPAQTSAAQLGAERAAPGLWSTRAALNRTQRQLEQARGELDGLRVPWDVSPYSQEEQEARQARAGELEKQISALTKREDELRIQEDDQDFAQRRQTPEYQAAIARAMAPGSYDNPTVDSRKPKHRTVKQAMGYFQAKDAGDEALAAAYQSGADMALDKMNEEQRDRLAYYVGTGDYDRAADYLKRIAPELNRQTEELVAQKTSQWAQEHPIQGALTNITAWPLNIPAYFDNARQGLENAVTGVERQSPRMGAYIGPKITAG